MEPQRFPVSVRVIGVMHKEKSKLYMTSVLWSDHSDIIVYRTFRDFKKLHKQMKKAFPATNRLKKSDRIIPRFKDRRVRQRDQRKRPTKSLLCLKFLEKYCNELLSCDPRVCQSADLIQFFHPKDQDLQPEFSKNGILIMPTDDEISTGARHSNAGNVTQPFVTETYRCVAPYETKDTKNKPFKVVLDEKVDVLIKDKSGWWLVEKDDKRMAWFPAPYLENVDDEENEDDPNWNFERGLRYTATKSYKATSDDEINVPIGAVVEILEKSDNGWWLVSYSGKAGYVPAMYLQPYNYPHIRMATQLQDLRAPSRLELPSSGLQLSHQLSRSQGNLLQPSAARSASPSLYHPDSKQRSHSLTIFSEQAPAPSAAQISATRAAIIPTSAKYATPPIIKVELDGQNESGRTLSVDSDGSLGSDSSDFSFRDDLTVSSESVGLSQSLGANDEKLRLSRTPPPTVGTHLNPTNLPENKIMPSVSDPSLYKASKSPMVPPRPRAQEILTRCSSVTRKRTVSGSLSPTQTEILGR